MTVLIATTIAAGAMNTITFPRIVVNVGHMTAKLNALAELAIINPTHAIKNPVVSFAVMFKKPTITPRMTITHMAGSPLNDGSNPTISAIIRPAIKE